MRKWIDLFENRVSEDVAARRFVPDVGTIVQVDDPHQWSDKGGQVKGKRSYRVNAWLKAAPEPKFDLDNDDDFDRWLDHVIAGQRDGIADIMDSSARRIRDGKRLMWCTRNEAEYLSGSGVAGAIIPVGEAEVIGRVNWPPERIEELRASALRNVGRLIH